MLVILKGFSELDEDTRKVLQEMLILQLFSSMVKVMGDNLLRIKQMKIKLCKNKVIM